MVYAYTQDVPIGVELYEKIIAAIGREPLAGSLMHLCVRRADGVRSRSAFIPQWMPRSAASARPANQRSSDSRSCMRQARSSRPPPHLADVDQLVSCAVTERTGRELITRRLTREGWPMGVELWPVIHAERSALVHDLARLRPWQWEAQSMCVRWTVREVAAHLAAMSKMTPGRFMGHLAGAGLRFNAMNAREVLEENRGTTAELLNEYRAHLSATTGPPWPPVLILGEIILHAQDIRRPLKMTHSYPQTALLQVANFYKRTNLLVGARRRIAGLRLQATDADWSHGRGGEVTGPLLALTLAMTGRTPAIDDLSGYGLDTLRSR
jgi:uncharacterized protein (TIGR03083 family)